MPVRSSICPRILPVATLMLVSGAVVAQDAAELLKRASDAMRAIALESIRYATRHRILVRPAYKPGIPAAGGLGRGPKVGALSDMHDGHRRLDPSYAGCSTTFACSSAMVLSSSFISA